MAYRRQSPQPVVEGGTGAQTFTAHGVLVGEGTSAVAVTAAGTTGQVLTGSTGADPVWASPAASSITITGDSGGGLTGSSFTFTGASTGLTFSGSGSTETITGTLIVGNGGTGVATMTTAYAPVCAGTTATGNLQVASTGLSTSGFVLTSNGASALPSFQAAGGAGLSSASVTLTSAQVKALHATPISLVATPGSGKALVMVMALAHLNYGGTNAFTNTGGGQLQIYYGSASGVSPSAALLNSGQITSTSNQIGYTASSQQIQTAASSVVNNALVVSNSSTTEFAGNAAANNTIDIFVYYLTVTV